MAVTPFVTGQNVSVSVSGSSATLTFYGIPNFTYLVERTTNLTAWVNISTNLTPANGIINATDNFSDLGVVPGSAYYRLKWQP
jgi:hypothetical protein